MAMPPDLDFFHESALYNSNVRDFRDSLPRHLRDKFEKCLNVDILWGNVLKGYRGPANMQTSVSDDSNVLPPSHGLIEIKFWWSVRSWINWPTLFLAIGTQKLLGHLKWSSLYFDSKTGECLSHNKSEAAEKLNERGNQLLEQGNYAEAAEYYENAYNNCDNGHQQRIYKANQRKAQDELNSINLCRQADHLFKQEKYNEARLKYQHAYLKSQVNEKKNMYESKRDKVQTLMTMLSELDNLWMEAWKAENDENDRSEEAKKIFQTLLLESKSSLKMFPDCSKLKQHETLATLKIEGNKNFNEGLESQQQGNTLFETAQKTKLQQNYESAKVKFEKAKNSFQAAYEKFEMGGKINKIFQPCIEFAQEHINNVKQSIKFTEQYAASARMENVHINIADKNHTDIHNSLELRENENHNIYMQNI